MSERRSELKAVAAGEDMASTKTPDRDLMVMTAQMMDGLAQVNSRDGGSTTFLFGSR